MKKVVFVGILVSMLIILPLLTACSSSASNTKSASPTGMQSTTSEPQTLKIGLAAWMGAPIGLDGIRGIRLMTEMDNAKGGLDIGGKKYKIQLIEYDTNNSQTTEVAAINKLVYEDKVKFIFSDETFVGAWLPITEPNKVLAFGGQVTDINLTPNLHYSFGPTFARSGYSVMIGWYCKNYPDLVKNVVNAFGDWQIGHMAAESNANLWKAYGVNITNIFYPMNAADLSSLGTKIKTLNPTTFGAAAGPDHLAINAAWQAGYRGKFMLVSGIAADNLKNLINPEALEGLICGAYPVEFDQPLTQTAKEFKDAWIAKNGKWEGPEILGTGDYACLRAALQQAGTLDTDKIADIIANGLKFEGPTGLGQMISRPDIGNERTVDSITTTYMKKVTNGKANLIATIDLNEGLQYFRQAYPISNAIGTK
jgi:branched-chain amino acid transport system substrate-binding protein